MAGQNTPQTSTLKQKGQLTLSLLLIPTDPLSLLPIPNPSVLPWLPPSSLLLPLIEAHWRAGTSLLVASAAAPKPPRAPPPPLPLHFASNTRRTHLGFCGPTPPGATPQRGSAIPRRPQVRRYSQVPALPPGLSSAPNLRIFIMVLIYFVSRYHYIP